MNDAKSIGERIKLLRTRKLKINQDRLGALIGVSAMAISKWESGKSLASPRYLKILADKTGVEFDWLQYGKLLKRSEEIMVLIGSLDEESREDLVDHFEFLLNQHLKRPHPSNHCR